MAAIEVDPQEFSGTIVVAYGDANAMRRGVAHAVLRDVLLHGPLDPGVPIDDDPLAWVEAFAAMRGAWLAGAFGVPAEMAAKHLATPLRAVLNSVGREVELVIDEQVCLDCAVARQVVAHVALAAGVELLDPPAPIDWSGVEEWRDRQLLDLPRWLDEALEGAATGDGNVAQAWDLLAELSAGTGLADLAACHLFALRLAQPDAPVRLTGGRTPDELVPACATSTLHEVGLELR
ncbi:MAG: hypothetical protein JWO69_227 [Thermoleophilia bacterium]|nr:hypothetical protein [Thermoleophilia bacterium]